MFGNRFVDVLGASYEWWMVVWVVCVCVCVCVCVSTNEHTHMDSCCADSVGVSTAFGVFGDFTESFRQGAKGETVQNINSTTIFTHTRARTQHTGHEVPRRSTQSVTPILVEFSSSDARVVTMMVPEYEDTAAAPVFPSNSIVRSRVHALADVHVYRTTDPGSSPSLHEPMTIVLPSAPVDTE